MNKVVSHVAVGVASLGVGFGIGYFIAKKRVEKQAEWLVDQVNATWEETFVRYQNGEFDTEDSQDIPSEPVEEEPVEAAPTPYIDQAGELEDELAAIPPDFPEEPFETTDEFTVEGQAPAVDAKAFVEQFKNRPVSDFSGVTYPGKSEDDEEVDDIPIKTVPEFVTKRDPNGPYVISIDEFMDPASDPPYTKVEMRWFAGDNVVVDSRDQQVPMSTVGPLNTLRFGEGTTDPNQVYIRNERLSIDIELTREEGLYLHEVLGQDFPEKAPVLKFRESDDS
jgi:hypothetical protein